MTDGGALIRAVLAAPEDDTPRLVYADWLDDLRTPEAAARAEYIRAAVECDRIPFGDPRKKRALDAELNAMAGRNWWSWYGPGDRVHVLQWRRGFVDELATDAATWLEHGDAITAAHPVRRVRLTTWPDALSGDHNARNRELYPAFLADRWSGVVFELPTRPSPFVTLEPRA